MQFWPLLFFLVLLGVVGRAEPLYPPLSKPQVDSLKARLWQTPPTTTRVDLLLRLSNDLILKDKIGTTPADSLYAFIRQAQRLSKALHFTDGELASRYSMGWLLCKMDGPVTGQQIIREALARSRQLHNLGREALGWYYLGLTTDRSPLKIAYRLKCFEQAARCYSLVPDLGRQAYCLKEAADIHFAQGKYLLAQQELLRVEALYRRSGSRRLHYTFDLQAAASAALGNYNAAVQYGLKAVASAKETRDTTDLNSFYYRIACLYRELKQPEKSEQYLQLSMLESEKLHASEDKAQRVNYGTINDIINVQQLTIRQREFQRNAFVIGAALLVLLLGLGYNRYRLGQRSNRLLEEKRQLLEAQQVEISQKNQSLEQVVSEKDQLLEERQLLLLEKDWMLKEIHHRVKNNLQIVSSLLATQSRHLQDPQALAAIRESENRVQVMAILHQKLYQADSIARVNMAEYGREIVTYLIQSFDQLQAVQTKLDLAAVELDATLATPLGLILNEAVTNALKHAFPSPRRGTILVGLVSLAPQQYQLTIADDGVGLPPDFDLKRSRSLGMVIMKGLSRQIDGDLSVTSAAGVCLTLQFATTKKPAYADAL